MTPLKAGTRLQLLPSSALHTDTRYQVDRLRLGPQSIVYATRVDEQGVSVYIKRGNGLPDLEGFIPAKSGMENWTSYFAAHPFEPANAAYVRSRHVKAVFPRDLA